MSESETAPDPGADGADPEPAEEPAEETPAEDHGEDEEKDVFRGVYGHEGAKSVISAALRQGETHILFEGPPGSGKSAFLMALESNLPGVMYRDGDQITASKLRDRLKEDPSILLIDEIDALDNDAYDVLSTPLEHGRVVRDSARESYDVSIGTQVIAACNHADELPEHIHNRFRTLEFDSYSEEEYADICSKMLKAEVGWVEDEETARRIANTVKDVTGKADPRETRDIAQMADSVSEIETLTKALHDPDANIEAGPLRPSEVARAQGEVGRDKVRDALVAEMVGERDEPIEAAEDGAEEAEDSDSNPGVQAEKSPSQERRSTKARPGPSEAEEEAVEAAVEEAVEEAADGD